MAEPFWRKCSSCKKEIGYSVNHYLCSVSTCNQKSTGYVFCSVPCFERHLPGARHKDAAAIQERSPSAASLTEQSTPTRRIISSGAPAKPTQRIPHDILIVASKLKDYVRSVADMNTSADVMERLSDIVRSECDRAIDQARRDGRKTLMARDFKSR